MVPYKVTTGFIIWRGNVWKVAPVDEIVLLETLFHRQYETMFALMLPNGQVYSRNLNAGKFSSYLEEVE